MERFGGSEPTRHRVRDLSTSGVRIDQAIDIRSGATVLVTVGKLQAVRATVKWLKEGSAGLKFAQPVNPADTRAHTAIAPNAIKHAPKGLMCKLIVLANTLDKADRKWINKTA